MLLVGVVCSLDYTGIPVVQSLHFGWGETEYKWWSMICFQFILNQMFRQAISKLPFDSVKTNLCAKPFIWKCFPIYRFIFIPIKIIFIWTVLHMVSFWNRGTWYLTSGNGTSEHPEHVLRESQRDFTRAELFCRSQLNCVHTCCSSVQSFWDVKCFKCGFTKGTVVLGYP